MGGKEQFTCTRAEAFPVDRFNGEKALVGPLRALLAEKIKESTASSAKIVVELSLGGEKLADDSEVAEFHVCSLKVAWRTQWPKVEVEERIDKVPVTKEFLSTKLEVPIQECTV